jgi:hypothetical protein
MRFLGVIVFILVLANFSHGRSLASIRKDAFTVGVNSCDSAAEYDFIAEITSKMKFSRFRLVAFENANAGQKLLLDGKIDAIVAKITYFSHLENKFLVSSPYGKMEIAVATGARNSEIWTLADLNGKPIAFIPKDISSEQISSIWQSSKPIAAKNLSDALNFLQTGQAKAIIANRQTLESEKIYGLRVFPNKLAENDIVALFALNSKDLHEEFNKALKLKMVKEELRINPKNLDNRENKQINKILLLLDELKHEIEGLK